MPNEILEGIAVDLKNVQGAIDEAEDLVSALKEAGEDVSEWETQIRSLKIRREKWRKMLDSRGVSAE